MSMEIKFKIEIDGEWIALTINEMLEYAEQCNDIIKNCKKRQYIGRKDKNGVEIYEGDIVKAYSFINGNFIDKTFSEHVVVYKHYGFTLDYIPQKQHTLSLYQDELEVVGNIYENHELLESK